MILPQISFKIKSSNSINDQISPLFYLFSGGFDQLKTLIKQPIIIDVLNQTTLKRCNPQWVKLLLNGEYQGLYLLENKMRYCICKSDNKLTTFNSDNPKKANEVHLSLISKCNLDFKLLQENFILNEVFDYIILEVFF